MKKYLIFLFLPLFVISSCSKNDIETKSQMAACQNPSSLYSLSGDIDSEKPCLIPQTERKTLVIYFMSTDCPGCGSWGTDLFHKILEENPSNTEGLQVHIKYSDPFILKGFSDSLIKRYNPRYTPFVMVENRVPAGTIQVNTDFSVLLPKAKNWVEEIAAETAEIAPAVNFKLAGDKVKIYYGGKYQVDTDASYSFGLYLMEDHLEYNQAGNTKRPYYHDNTIRTAVDGAWGIPLPEGNHNAGEIFLGETETELIGYWKQENLHLLGVVWKRDASGKMEVVNTVSVR